MKFQMTGGEKMPTASYKILIVAKHRSQGIQLVKDLREQGIHAILAEQEEIIPRETNVSYIVLSESGPVKEQNGILYVPQTLDNESICTIIRLFLHYNNRNSRMDSIASEILQTAGIRPKLKGHSYIKTAMLLIVEQNKTMYRITDLYQEIADQYGVRAGGVERAIRHAINIMYDTDAEKLQRFFNYPVEKPSSSELIAHAADLLRIQISMENANI